MASQRDIKWADGLRGIASVLIVTGHIIRAFAPGLVKPTSADHERPSIFHLPFIRLPVQGPAWVAIFFILTGYVNAMKPIRQARQGNTEEALSNLARSTFRRTGRLVLPPTIATVASWAMCQLGAYDVARQSDSDWMRNSTPAASTSFFRAFTDLFHNLFTTWAEGSNAYDPIQWTLPFLLKGSFVVFLTLLATVYAKPHYRMSIVAFLFIYSWQAKDPLVGMNIFAGTFLAEFSLLPWTLQFPTNRTFIRTFMPLSLVLIGLYLSSYPEERGEWTSWSFFLLRCTQAITPSGVEIWRYLPAIGVPLIIIGIILSPPLQNLLSLRPLLWLGNISYPLYLIHGPLLHSLLSWMLFGFSSEVRNGTQNDESGKELQSEVRRRMPQQAWMYVVALPVFGYLLLTAANAWSAHVERYCARVMVKFEERVCGPQAKKMTLPVTTMDSAMPAVGILA